ncbi:hypothetical protein P5E35_14500 [Clostridium perfringens]|nr:hypothetical protein [Clostridium perfringens]
METELNPAVPVATITITMMMMTVTAMAMIQFHLQLTMIIVKVLISMTYHHLVMMLRYVHQLTKGHVTAILNRHLQFAQKTTLMAS